MTDKTKSGLLGSAAKIQIIYTTTDGRAKLPAIIQDVCGTNGVVAFHRYGRFLGALISNDALRALAEGFDVLEPDVAARIQQSARRVLDAAGIPVEPVDPDIEARIRKNAKGLLAEIQPR